MKNRLLSAILAVSMLASMLPVSAFAEEPITAEPPVATAETAAAEAPAATEAPVATEVPAATEVPVATEEPAISEETVNGMVLPEESYIPDAAGLPDNDELFAGYTQMVLYNMGDIATMGEYGETIDKSSLAYKLYSTLKPEIKKVAAGQLASTVFTVDITDRNIVYDGSGSFPAEITDAYHQVTKLLLADCPYDLYWYDKTVGTNMESKLGAGSVFTKLIISFNVCDAYKGADDYTANTAKTGAAAAAVGKAQEIVTANAGKSNYEKLVAYRDAICGLVSYNTEAAANPSTPFGDPWQLIYVFDDDAATKVVCEGYSKAFQYLCDLSSFTSGVTCYSVTGTMAGGTGAGPHMWNIVTLEDKNYLVDVTNSDMGTVGEGGGLFLAGVSGSVDTGYTFHIGPDPSPTNVIYTYDSDTKSLYGNSILELDNSDYTPPATLGDTNKGDDDWYKGPVTVNAPAGFTISSTKTGTFGASFTTTTNGDVTYFLKKSGGTAIGPKTIAVRYDAVAPVKPTLSITTAATDTTVTLTAGSSDATSGIQEYTLTGNSITQTNATGVFALTGLTPNTNYSFTVKAKDNAGNVSDASDACAVKTKSKSQNALNITGLPTTFTYGDTFTLGTTGGSGTGAVAWAVTSGTAATINATTGAVEITGVGAVTITATKAGDATYSEATATASFTSVAKALTASISCTGKPYDGTTDATVTYTLAGKVGSDDVTASGTAAYTTANAGIDIKVIATDITLSGAKAANYTVNTYTTTAANITAVAVTVTADAKTKAYGAADPALTYSATGLVGTETLTGALTRAAGENAGSYAITQGTLTNANNPNYTISFTGANLIIDQKAITADMITAAAQTYDGTAKTPVVVKNGDTTLTDADCSITYTSNVNAGSASYTVTGKGNYTGSITGSFAIANAVLTVAAKAQSVEYGTSIATGTEQVTVTGLVPGDTLTGITLTTTDKNVTTTGTITAAAATTTKGAGNYTIAYNPGALTITAKALTATITCSGKTYDGTNAATVTYALAGKVGSDDVSATGTATYANANKGTGIAVTATGITLSGADKDNYTVNTAATTTADITAKAITVVVSQPADVDYTGSKFTPAVTVTDGTNALPSGEYTVTYGANTNAGSATVTVKAAATSNYSFADVTKAFTINKIAHADATATATYTYTSTGTKTLDLSTLNLPDGYVLGIPSTSGTGISTVSYNTPLLSYTLTGTAAKNTTATVTVPVTASTNYIAFNIVLTVTFTEKTITDISGVTAATGLVYNAAAQPGYTGTPSFTKGYTGDDLTVTYYAGTSASGTPLAGAPTAVGSYTVLLAVPDTNAQYTGSTTLQFTIGKAPLTVTAAAKTIAYGETPANAGVTYTGFAGNEGASVLVGTLTYTYNYVQYGNVGEYTITPAGLTADNYTITFKTGVLTVAKRPITVAVDNKTSVYGAALLPLTSAVSSGTVVNSDTAYTLATTATATSAVGEYPITGTANSNYAVTYVGGKYTITAANLTGVDVQQSGTLTYNGKPQSAAVTTAATAVNAQAVTFTYSSTSGGTYTAAVPAFTNAGTYTVYYKAAAANHNTATGSFTVTIGVKTLTNAMATAGGCTYSGSAQAPVVMKDGEITVAAADYDIAYTNNVNAGTASYTVTGKGNYTGSITGSFAIAPRPLTWDISELSTKKPYDGNTNAIISGTLKVSGVLAGEDAQFSYDALTGKYADSEIGTAKPVTVTVTNAQLGNANYALPSAGVIITGHIAKPLPTPPEPAPDASELKLVVEQGIPEVPAALKTNPKLDTTEKIKEAMKAEINRLLPEVPATNITVMDIALWYSKDNGSSWTEATKNQFPTQGITTVVPYAELNLTYTAAQGMDFTIVHMISAGDKAGTPENPDYSLVQGGIQFTLHSLSPVTIAYKAKPVATASPAPTTVPTTVPTTAPTAVPTATPTVAPSGSTSTGSAAPSVTAAPTAAPTAAAAKVPATGDSAPLTLWFVLMALAAAGFGIVFVLRRKKSK